MQYSCRKQTDTIVQKTDFPTPKQIFYITPQEHFIYKLIAKKKYLVIKSQLFKKRNTDKKVFFPYIC